ncbi:hypothetical protein ASPCAL12562 [Aspergillus calidoustus]|uniref:Methyltransferase type 11 domain-containing protein n=1 Tax=Aspergillus calidoustus TaxID=454130 RepID=A0A0U5GAX0_ASPCI|nr:hypothetical protein ASPCAL12562 [Aspergillus calidoustus]
MSYKSDGGRIPRLRDFGYQSRNASTPAIATQTSSSGSGAPPSSSRLQIPKLITPSTKSRRTASMSDAEQSRPIVAQSNPLLNPDPRPYIPPRAPTHPPLSQSPQSATIDRQVPRALHPPVVPQTPIDNRTSAQSRPRNVLRRRAPTIGQHSAKPKSQTESMSPGGLNVIIPSSSQSSSQTELARKTPSPMVSSERHTTNSSAEQPTYTGPKELASLRTTTINTQNLPPFTPIFPSASTPSTRYSGSPGVWSRASTSTPASLSSCSPGIIQPMKVGPRLRQPSPSQTRLPVFSPQAQKPSLPSSPAAGKSPNLVQTFGSTTSLVTENRENATETPETTKPPTPSLLPRRMSMKSSLPRQVRTTPDIPPKSEKVDPKRVVADSPGAAGVSSPSRPSPQIPVRPSREGTTQLDLEPSPVVRANIPARVIRGHKRRISAESTSGALASNQSAATSVDSLNSLASSRIRSPTSPEVSRKSPRTLTKDPHKASPADTSPAKTRRFGLFPRKSKPDLDARQTEARPARKGPAAGTGHEGYGKYAQRGRKTSVSSSSDTRARSTSTTKSASSKASTRSRADTELDDFFLERLEPVYINGGGMDGASLSRTQSEQSTGALSTKSAPGHTPVPPSGYFYEPSATSKGGSAVHRRDLSSPATISAPRTKAPTLASPEKSKSGADIRSPTQTQARSIQPDTAARHAPTQTQLKKPSKRGLHLKWPFFQRDSEPPLPKQTAKGRPAEQLPAQVATVGARRPVAHYAMVDTDSDPLEDIFHNLEDSPPTEEEEVMAPVEVPAGLRIRKQHESILLPSPPTLQSEFPVIRPSPSKTDSPKSAVASKTETSPEQRPSRLASVGRIPRVVSRRDRQHKPALQSFSRPFSITESPSLTVTANDRSHAFSSPDRHEQGLHPDLHHKLENPSFDLTSPFGDPKGSVLDFLSGPYSRQEFLAFSPRKDSVFSTSSGSESLAAITAVIPRPGTDLTEDEVWGEYDEFIDHVLSPETPNLPFPRGLETCEKFELAARASRALQAGLNSKLVVPSTPEQPMVSLTPASPRSSVHLRRSKIANALHASLSPTSQPSVSDLMARYRDDKINEEPEAELTTEMPTPTIAVEQPPSSLLSSPSLDPSPSFENCRQRNTILFDIAERDREGPTAQTNIRSGSLMTSRWLSFGRVLFSPAHNHVKQEQERILVVDGLGNDDWSFYCALTYPKAVVYCLHEGPTPTASRHPAAWQPPSNHHTIHHSSLENPVPFPKGFFAVTVLRFPAACSEAAQNNIISECKRVLRPGGYLEMSILDHDMVNMGVRTRRAVRKLKETMYLSDASISLKPASDNIQRLLGTHGFDSLRRCMVQIPVAGMIVRTSASSTSTSSSNPSTLTAAVTSSTALSATSATSGSSSFRSNTHEKSSSNDTVLSLGDLLSDPSPSPSNDESIRKIVARVGRWWYTRCYESPVLPNGDVDRSIWANKKVLRECQQRGTGFRLLIAYTQKPSEKRRTASV